MEVVIDDEFKNLIPPLSKEEYCQLEKNVLHDGCREALIVWGCTLIDGHNRFEICTNYSLNYSIQQRDFRSREEVIEWIILNQFGRRNLSAYDRSLLALRLGGVYREKAKEKLKEAAENTNKKRAGETPLEKSTNAPIDTRKELARIADVSDNTIHKVQFIEEHGDKEIKDKIRSNALSINSAYNQLRGEEKKENPIEYADIYNRRVTLYPKVRLFMLHIAHSFDQLQKKGDMAERILKEYYGCMPLEKQQRLLDIFKTMTPEQIENTGNLKAKA